MTARFAVGQKVRLAAHFSSRKVGQDTQWLDPKQTYVVTDVVGEVTPFGVFVAYDVKGGPAGSTFRVVNGHIVLERV